MSVKKGQNLKRKEKVEPWRDHSETIAIRDTIFSSFEVFCQFLYFKGETEDGSGVEVQFHPDTWFEEQKLYVKNRTKKDLILKSRRIGMTTVNFALDLWFVLTNPNSNVLVMLQSEQPAKEAYDQLWFALSRLYDLQEELAEDGHDIEAVPVFPGFYRQNQEEIYLQNESKIIIRAAGSSERAADKKVRSMGFQRAHLSEMAYWDYAEATLGGVLNAIKGDGCEVVIESTPKNNSGAFFKYYDDASHKRNGYTVHFWPWYFHKAYKRPATLETFPKTDIEHALFDPMGSHNIGREQLAWWQEKVTTTVGGLEKVLIDFPIDEKSCWLSQGSAWLSKEKLAAKSAKEKSEPIRILKVKGMDIQIFREPVLGTPYIIGADTASGNGGDSNALCVLNAYTNAVVATGASNWVLAGDFGLVLAEVAKLYNGALVAPERNNTGHAVIRALISEARYYKVYTHIKEEGTDTDEYGWSTDTASRPTMLTTLETVIDENSSVIPCADLYDQLGGLVRVRGKDRVVAEGKGKKDGKSDDLVFAYAIALEVRIRAARLWNQDKTAQRLNAQLSTVTAGRNFRKGMSF